MARKKQTEPALEEQEVFEESYEAPSVIEIEEEAPVVQEQPKLSLEDRYKQLGTSPRQASVGTRG